jgi:hypothetical protein
MTEAGKRRGAAFRDRTASAGRSDRAEVPPGPVAHECAPRTDRAPECHPDTAASPAPPSVGSSSVDPTGRRHDVPDRPRDVDRGGAVHQSPADQSVALYTLAGSPAPGSPKKRLSKVPISPPAGTIAFLGYLLTALASPLVRMVEALRRAVGQNEPLQSPPSPPSSAAPSRTIVVEGHRHD